MHTIQQIDTRCYHCGAECGKTRVTYEDKDFCCHGCKMVYELLNENGLCDYYQYETTVAGNKPPAQDDKYLFLDDKEIASRLLDFSSPRLNKITFYIPKIHCSSCIYLLENLPKLNPAVMNARINFTEKTISIDYNPGDTSLRLLAEMLAGIGYDPHISLANEVKRAKRSTDRSLYIKIGVAGFCFANIMLLSFPAYLGDDAGQDNRLRVFFSALNILLALPTVFYSGSDYLVSAFKAFKQRFLNIDAPIAMGIGALFGRSLFEILILNEAGYLDSLSGFIFFLLIGKWFQNRTYQNLSFDRDFRSYFPLAALKCNDGVVRPVSVSQIRPGDALFIRNQEIIPCDGIVTEGPAYIDYSFVTGESRMVEASVNEQVYAGGRHSGAGIKIEARKSVSQSYLTQLWNNEAFEKEKENTGKAMLDKVGRYFTWAVLLIAFSAFLIWLPVNIGAAFNAFTATLIVACPCALALSAPFAYGTAARILGKNKMFLKKPGTVEALNRCDHIVFDKTGTLTESEKISIRHEGDALTAGQKRQIAALTFHSTHPLSRRIFEYCKLPDASPLMEAKTKNFKEIPGKGISGTVDGHSIRIGSPSFMQENPLVRTGQNATYLEIDGKLTGKFIFEDVYRDGLNKIIARLAPRYRLSVLSGDNDREKTYLSTIFPSGSALLFNQKPEDKLEFIKGLQAKGAKPLMVGDGLNDAGALKQSEAGIAATEDATYFSPASDALIDASQLSRLPEYLRFGRGVKTILAAGIAISFIYNVAGLSFAVTGALTPIIAAILMPLSSVSVVGFATLSVGLWAKFLRL